MINLIKNELIKILKKKSIYIILIITLLFIILTNVMYKNNRSLYYSSYTEDSLTYYEETLKEFDPKDPSENNTYVDLKGQVEMLRLIKNYGYDSWQAYVIPNHVVQYIDTMLKYEYSLENHITEKEYGLAKKNYNDLIEKLNNNDWRYFANIELENTEQQINSQTQVLSSIKDIQQKSAIESELHHLQIQKQILNWRLEKDISYGNNFMNNTLNKYMDQQDFIYNYEHSDNHTYEEKRDYYVALRSSAESIYYIENDIRNIDSNDNRGILLTFADEYELFILIFIIMIAGSIVSDEFNKGTIKLLLVRPYHRAKILLSKFIVCMITLILCIVYIAVMQFIIGGIIQGFDSLNIPALVYHYNTNQLQTMNLFTYTLINVIAKLPMYILLMTLAFACSTIFINTAISIVLPLLGYMASSLINQLALVYDIKAILYFVTPNWNLTDYLWDGLPMFEGLSFPFSLTICLVYFIIMMITSLIVFKKRNIKNI